MRINISSREGALILGFDSISFKPAKSTTGTGYNAVNSTGNFTLYVIYKGECTKEILQDFFAVFLSVKFTGIWKKMQAFITFFELNFSVVFKWKSARKKRWNRGF